MSLIGLGAGAFYYHGRSETVAVAQHLQTKTSLLAQSLGLTNATSNSVANSTVNSSPDYTEQYMRSPEHVVTILRRSYAEFRQDREQFYREELGLSGDQMSRLESLEQENSVSDDSLPIEAGIEVVTEKIFGGRSYRNYLAQTRKVLGEERFAKLSEFLEAWPKKVASRDPEFGDYFSCCVVLSGR